MKTATPERIDSVPSNIIQFPKQLCRKVTKARKLTARIPQKVDINIRPFPQRDAPSLDVTHGLFAETREILARCSGVASQWIL